MIYVFKFLFLFYIITNLVVHNAVTYANVVIVLLLCCISIFRHRFSNSPVLIAAEFAVIVYASFANPIFTLLIGYIAFDFVYKKIYYGLIPVLAAGIYFSDAGAIVLFCLITGICSISGYLFWKLSDEEEGFKNAHDMERRYRYELEQARLKLLNSSKDVARLAEARERNRIARDIHDNVGHSIAGVLMQLQASYKLRGRDDEKSGELLCKSIEGLSSALAVLRDTVHNIKPAENLGVDYIKNIIDNFSFCAVDFRYTGDFGTLSANCLEIISANIKEALTNASKYSKATRIDIAVDITDKFIRLYIKDNGIGCAKVSEGLGISGMKERIRNIGGSISINVNDGFMIVCIIPLEEGGTIFENIDSGRRCPNQGQP